MLFANQKLFTDCFELFTNGSVHKIENHHFNADCLNIHMAPRIEHQPAIIFGAAS